MIEEILKNIWKAELNFKVAILRYFYSSNGTGVKDYMYVVDLAQDDLKNLNKLDSSSMFVTGKLKLNLGSVLCLFIS